MLVLALIVILGLAAGIAGQSWKSLMQRAREAELLWCGEQYRQAIGRYYQVRQGAPQVFPAKLEDLLKDPRFPQPVRHLRRLYKDPMTGGEWELIKEPAGRIIGVRSSSPLKPFQQDGFPKELEAFRDKESYREWEFIYEPGRRKPKSLPQAAPAPRPEADAGKL
jgi:type II secretory pathway pseudopilin PulG